MVKSSWFLVIFFLSSCQSIGKPSPQDLRPAELLNENKPLIWPTVGPVSSEFGKRWGRTHRGVDITGNKGQKIQAAAGGVVSKVGWIKGYGQTVVIDHKGYKTLYAHLQKSLVKSGHQVKQGEDIALMGRTGNAKGFHLHFEYRNANNKTINPREYLPSRSEFVLYSQN